MPKIKTAELFVKALENENVEYIFGIPGEENLDLLEALRLSKIKLVLTRHEQAAGFMAATIGRLTGKVGVAISTLGPGATNFATAAAYAQLAGFPMMMITGQKPIRKSKQGSFQIVDIVENMKPITKYTRQIADGDLVAASVREATRVAEEERPGAVHLELPEDIAETMTDFELFPVNNVRRPIAENKAIDRAVNVIEKASRPLILIGAGANRKRAQKMLKEFIDITGIPFVTTQMGKGVVTEAHPLYMGCCALSVNDFSNMCCDHADIIINVGHDVVEKPPFFMHHGRPPVVIHINFYSAKVDNVYFPQLEVVGDIANAIYQIKEAIKKQPHWDFAYYMKTKRELEAHLAVGVDSNAFPMWPQRVVAEIRKVMPDDGYVCLDNGMYKIWFARCYKAYCPNTLLLDNSLATMGAGLPSAMAAALLEPQKKVVAVCGDGGFMMNSQELETAVRLRLNFVVIILNDNAFGMIKWKQGGMHFKDFGLDLQNPDFVKYAESYGAKAFRVTSAEECGEVLHRALYLEPPGVKLVEIPINYGPANDILNKELPGLLEKKAKQEEPIAPFISSQLKEATAEPPTECQHGVAAAETTPPPIAVAKIATGAGAGAGSSRTGAPRSPRSSAVPQSPTKLGAQIQGLLTSVGLARKGMPYREFPIYIANKAFMPNKDLEVINKYTGEIGARTAQANEKHIDEAITAALAAAPAMAAMGSFERKAVLETVVREVKERFDEFAYALCMEAGKPIKDARGEVQRLIDTFQIAAEESVRMYGEWAPLDISERAKGYQSLVRRFPIGVISMVSPFNFPLNLAAHKIAPALAVGCPFVMKPASRTPIGALLLGDILSKCHLPVGAFSILPCTRESADLFTTDERFKLLSFTGSPSVGWAMKARAGKKKVVLELGGNAAVVVDDLVPDIKVVVGRIIHGAFYQSGQSCISVQRIFVREALYEQVKSALVDETSRLKKGNPFDETTFIGPIIHESEAKRIEKWVDSAVQKGGKVLVGGKRDGVFYDATIIEDPHPESEVYAEEVFGPVATIQSYTNFRQVIEEVNQSKFGLQAGVFTTDLNKAFYAFQTLDVGGVVVNDVPSMRVDSQPYGGVKESGLGREGIRYAMEDMTETRVMIMKNVGDLK